MELTQAISRNIVQTTFEDIPPEAVEATKRSILDTIGVMFPSTTQEKACTALAEIVKEEGGREESTLVGFGSKAPCLAAAFLNGSLTHAMDYDDTTDAPPYHPTASAFPAALAIAEKAGNVSGKDFITAVALGTDLGVRLSACLEARTFWESPWFNVTSLGIFATTTAAGKILQLSENETVNALGIAANRGFGANDLILMPDSQVRAIRDGFTNREGLLSALMAAKGITGGKEALERYLDVYYKDSYDARVLVKDLGKRFRGAEASIKPWPACRSTHACIQAALEIITEHKIEPEQIEEVLLTVGKQSQPNCEPLEIRRHPELSIQAKFSLPFAVAVALTKKEVKITHFLAENLDDPQVLEMAGRINYKVDPSFGLFVPAVVEIKTRDNRTFSGRTELIYGNPQKPISEADQLAKFRDCVRYAKNPLSPDKIDRLIGKVLNMEEVKDITEITGLLN
ncbi:MAG: MmgE/PrpD family protein [Dehalococcoidia bacterium]